MDGIVIILILCAFFTALGQAAKKQSGGKQTTASGKDTAKTKDKPKKAKKTKQATQPVMTSTAQTMSAERPAPYRQMQPRVTLTRETDDMFEGSLHADSHEGEDPCHEQELRPVAPRGSMPTVPANVRTSDFALDFDADNMMRAFVMQEVLTRPCQRRRHV